MDKMEKRHKRQPWSPADATNFLNELGRSDEIDLLLRDHAEERMLERNLLTGDIMHVLKFGFVYAHPVKTTQNGYFKYAIENKTPNSGARSVRVIVIPDCINCDLKIITVMWKDENVR